MEGAKSARICADDGAGQAVIKESSDILRDLYQNNELKMEG